MENLLKQLNDNFHLYIKDVDSFYVESTKEYSSLFGAESDRVTIFCRAISHIIRHFLEKEDVDSLFIEVPVDELAAKPNLQDKNFIKMEEAIGHTLAMAVYPDYIEAPEIKNAAKGAFYYTADIIEGKSRLWEVKIGQNSGENYPSEQFCRNGNSLGKAPKLRTIFNEHKDNTYQLKSLPENFNKPTQRKMIEMAKMLAVYKANKFHKRYNNALLIGYGNPKNIICNYPYLGYPLEFTNKYNNVESQDYDIIVCSGDRYHLGCEMLFNNRLACGKTKKIIYIGTKCPKDFNGKVFSFSYREMYHYSAGNNTFPQFKIHNLEWKELFDLFEKISEIFSNDCLNTINDIDKIKRYVNSHIIFKYICKEPNERLEDGESLQDGILNVINSHFSSSIDNDQWNFLEKSFEELSLPDLSKNPKNDKFNIIENFNKKNSQHLSLSPCKPYKAKIKEVCKKNKRKNTFAIDAPIDSYQYIDIVKTLFKNLALGAFHVVSFFKLKQIYDFILRETEAYKQEYRKNILPEITYSMYQTTRQEYGSLDNFDLDLDILNDKLKVSASMTYYTLTDEEGKTYVVFGNAIRSNQLIDTDKLFEYREDWLPCELCIYQRPENFHELRDILYDLPKGQNIETYSNLWKNRLKARCHDKYEDQCKDMIETDGMKFAEGVVKKVVKDKYTSKFPNCYSRLFNRMKDLGILNQDEHNYCNKARKANENSKLIGRKLKDGIFNYVLTGECNSPEVNEICSKSNNTLTLDDLKELCIKTVTIIKIEKSNNNHDDE